MAEGQQQKNPGTVGPSSLEAKLWAVLGNSAELQHHIDELEAQLKVECTKAFELEGELLNQAQTA